MLLLNINSIFGHQANCLNLLFQLCILYFPPTVRRWWEVTALLQEKHSAIFSWSLSLSLVVKIVSWTTVFLLWSNCWLDPPVALFQISDCSDLKVFKDTPHVFLGKIAHQRLILIWMLDYKSAQCRRVTVLLPIIFIQIMSPPFDINP